MKKTKLVFFLISKLDGGGVTSIAVDLAKELKVLGYETVFIYGTKTGSHFKDETWIKKQGFRIYRTGFKEGKSLATIYTNLQAYIRYISLLIKYKPDVIHCHSRSMTLFSVIGRTVFQTRNLLTIHLQFFPKGSLLNLLMKYFHGYIAISQEIEDDLKRLVSNRNKIHKICNGVDDSVFYPREEQLKKELKARHGFKDGHLTLLVVARLEKVKSVDVLIKALAELEPDARKKLECLIVGDGTQMNHLVELTKEYNLQTTVHFLGYKKPNDYYALSDVFILPSTNEGFAVVVVEAMLSGLTVVKTPTAGTRDQVIDGKNGLLFPFYDSKKLSDHIQFLLANDDKLKSMQKEAYSLAKSKFTLKQMAAETAKVYESLEV